MFDKTEKVAIVYDRVNKWGGAERVLLAIHEIFPDAPLYTSVYNAQTARWAKIFSAIHTSFLQKCRFLRTRHEMLASLMPIAFESIDFSEYNLVISVTSEAAKGIITKPGTRHLCYMLTPTRYLWSGYNEYFKAHFLKGIAKPIVKHLRKWDKVAAQRPDKIVAISTEVQKRIKKYYNRDSEIVFPPVNVEKFVDRDSSVSTQNDKEEDYYLIVSRLVPYKRVDLVIKTFNELGDKLVVVGIGKQETYLKNIAKENIHFAGFVGEDRLVNYYKNAKAFIFPQVEDFGITAVEAQAAGIPVIAYKDGGVLDTVVDGKTGIYFEEQTVDCLINAILRSKKKIFDKGSIIRNAQKYSIEKFKEQFKKIIK